MTASILNKIYPCGEMRNKMKKLSIMALAISAVALAAVAILKLFKKKSTFIDDDFDDEFDDYDFETDCCSDDNLDVVIPAEENDETVEVKVEENIEAEKTSDEETSAEEKTE